MKIPVGKLLGFQIPEIHLIFENFYFVPFDNGNLGCKFLSFSGIRINSHRKKNLLIHIRLGNHLHLREYGYDPHVSKESSSNSYTIHMHMVYGNKSLIPIIAVYPLRIPSPDGNKNENEEGRKENCES